MRLVYAAMVTQCVWYEGVATSSVDRLVPRHPYPLSAMEKSLQLLYETGGGVPRIRRLCRNYVHN